ncbi:MAG TPA: DUF535 family protein [Mariprofundaceae bacterium]|nr:DUF535 family protein [Mariprofundaceae bacterium]
MNKLSRFSALVERSHGGMRVEHRFRRLVLRTAVQALRYSPYITDWYPSLDDPLMLRILEAHPRICEKVVRPYLRCGLSYGERHRALIGQYHWLRSHLTASALEAVFVGDGLELAHLSLAGVGEYRLVLRYYDQFEMEGDLTLSLVRADGLRIYSMTFSMLAEKDGLHAQIGGSQGGAGELGETVRQLTKAMQGMRPKALVLFALMRIAKGWGATRLSGIRSANHVYQCQPFRRGRRQRVQADYDVLWQDAGGSVAQDNPRLYDLPLVWQTRPIEEIAPNKRAMYRRRYAMLDALGAELDRGANLACAQGEGAA